MSNPSGKLSTSTWYVRKIIYSAVKSAAWMQFTQNLESNAIYQFYNFGVFVFRHTFDKIGSFLACNFKLCFKGNSLLNLLR